MVATPKVELQLGGTWTDVSDYVRYKDAIKITRGQKSEGRSSLDNATCDLTFGNDDGRFSPRHPMSPYYGLLGRNTPIRVSIGGGYRFHGEVAEWPPKRDISGKDATVSVKAAGVSRRLKQGDQALRSPIFRSVSAIGSVVSYWPFEDAKEATVVASSDSATAPMRISGAPEMAGYGEFTSSDPLPVCGTGRFSGTVVPYFTSGELLIRLFVFVDEPVTGETSLLRVKTTGSAVRWEVTLFDDGDLGTYAYDSNGTQLLSNRTNFLLNGRGYLTVDLQLTQDGSDIDWVTRIVDFANTDALDDGFSYTYASGTLSSRTFGQARGVIVGNGGGLTKVIVGHLLVCTHIADVFDDGGVLGGFATDYVYKALVAYNGENPTSRMDRLCDEEGVAFTAVDKGITSGNFVRLGDQPNAPLLDLVQEAADADLGILFEPRDSLGLAYRSRLSMYNQAAALTLSCADHQLNEALEPTDDDQGTANDITVKREAGSSVRVEQTIGPLSTAAPENGGVGRYDSSVTLSLETDGQLPDQAGWRLHLGTVDEARYPKVTVHLSHPAFTADPALKAAALAIDVGDRIVITDPSPDLPPDDISQIVIGYSEVIDQFEHTITYVCQPESPWHVGQTDTAGYDRIDTGRAVLAADATPTDTSLSVASTSGRTVNTTVVYDTPGTYTFTAPSDVTSVKVECWGGGGSGGASGVPAGSGGGGGGGGEYAADYNLAVTAGGDHSLTVGAGSSTSSPGGNSSFTGTSSTVVAHGGSSTSSNIGAGGGTGSTNPVHFAGGAAANGNASGQGGGAGGGAGASGTGGPGGGAANAPNNGGAGGDGGGGAGGGGGVSGGSGQTGSVPGGGGGGKGSGGNAGNGAGGQVRVTYQTLEPLLWTTNPGDLPFDILVAGERMTVTAVSGTSSPQTFAVTRSVNGVIKAQSSGAAVAIAEPVAVAL